MELSELQVSENLTEQILIQKIPIIRIGDKGYAETFEEITRLLTAYSGIVVMGYSPKHDYVALTGGDVMENPRVYFINIPISPLNMEEKLQQIVTQIGLE